MNIQKLLMFLGPVRTGHTLIASLLSAHREVSVSVEYNIPYRILVKDLDPPKVISMIISKCEKRKSISKGGYEYKIDGNSQNLVNKTRVLGDSMAGIKYMKLIEEEEDIKKIRDSFSLPIKWILVYRNPFDIITSSHNMNNRGVKFNLEIFKKNISLIEKISSYPLVKNNMFVIYLDDLIKNPKKIMKKTLNFLGVEGSSSYLELCSSQIFAKPNKVFDRRLWKSEYIDDLNLFISKREELERYHNEFQAVS